MAEFGGMVVGELVNYSTSALRLRDEDILVVQSNKLVSVEGMARMRADIVEDLKRLGIAEPKVLALPSEVTLSVIERS